MTAKGSSRPSARPGLVALMLASAMALLVSLPIQVAAQDDPGEAQLDASPAVVKRWIAYLDSIGKLDPAPLMRAALAAHQSQSQDFQDVSLPIPQADMAAFEEGKRRGKLELQTALRIFHQDSFGMYARKENPQDSVDITVLSPKGSARPGDLQVILVNQGEEAGWGTKFHLVQGNCYLGSNWTFHKYGLEHGTAVLGGGQPVFWNNASLESGTGIWENEMQFTTVVDQHPVLVGWLPMEINLSNPTQFCRHVWTKVLQSNPLRVQYDWDVELGYRYRSDPPIFRGRTVVEYGWDAAKKVMVPRIKSGNLDDKKLLSLSLDSPRELFIQAWGKELKSALESKNVARRREVIEFLGD